MADQRHPASDGGRYDIPDVADQTAQEAEDARVEPQERGTLDYADADIPQAAEETAEIAERFIPW